MKKNFTLLLILFIAFKGNTQEDTLRDVDINPYPGISGHANPNGSCDSLNISAANNWSAYYYDYGGMGGGGYVFGTTNLNLPTHNKVVLTANYFDASTGGDYNYISGGLVYFAYANSNVPANLSKYVRFILFDDAGGKPGAVLDSAKLTLGQIHEDVLQGKLTEFKFAAPVALPASKKFYIAVDHHSFKWNA